MTAAVGIRGLSDVTVPLGLICCGGLQYYYVPPDTTKEPEGIFSADAGQAAP